MKQTQTYFTKLDRTEHLVYRGSICLIQSPSLPKFFQFSQQTIPFCHSCLVAPGEGILVDPAVAGQASQQVWCYSDRQQQLCFPGSLPMGNTIPWNLVGGAGIDVHHFCYPTRSPDTCQVNVPFHYWVVDEVALLIYWLGIDQHHLKARGEYSMLPWDILLGRCAETLLCAMQGQQYLLHFHRLANRGGNVTTKTQFLKSLCNALFAIC